MKQHITRAYNSFSINSSIGTITKTSTETRLKNEINYYNEISKIKNKCSVFFPRLIDSFEDHAGYGMELEYYAYSNLGDYMVYGEFDASFWESIATQLQEARVQFLKTQASSLKNNEYAAAMYIDKTEKYYYDLIDNFPQFKSLSEKKSLIIDNTVCLSFATIWDDVKDLIHKELLPLGAVSIIHGDFCFSNILCGENNKTNTMILKFVDPRGSFGVEGVYGDPLYDAAKLLHSYEGGYEYIIFDEFEVLENETDNYSIQFSNDNKNKIATVFSELTDFRSLKSKLIEGLIYIGMCSRHYDSADRQLAMYLTGLKTLNQAIQGEIE
tara:strand:- start:4448 stop:5425 length:978 start_codon:yes stop_codon:yes gene_type:complete